MKVICFLILFAYFDNLSGVSVSPDKTVNPSENVNFVVSTGGKIELTWNRSKEPDIFCYNVYTSTISGGPYKKINPHIVPPQKFVIVNSVGGEKISAWVGEDITTATQQYSSYRIRVLQTPQIECTFENGNIVKSPTFTNAGLLKVKHYYVVTAVNFFGIESQYSNEAVISF